MHTIQKIAEDLFTLGGSTYRVTRFENLFPISNGISFNSFFLNDEKLTVFDTVDLSVSSLFRKNLETMLEGRFIDYLVVTHAEPDHSALVGELLNQFPSMQVICTEMCRLILQQFLGFEIGSRCTTVHDGSSLCTGLHTLEFFPAPMVHWPEVMMVFDKRSRVLFSADAFGSFGALNGTVFADSTSDYSLCEREMRRYYAGIICKFAAPVHRILNKLTVLPVSVLCPLHGPCYRRGISILFERYRKWSNWQPEEQGVVVITGSVYGHTEWYANLVSTELVRRSIPVMMYDASIADISEIMGSILRYSHVIVATMTYNNGVFPRVEQLVTELVERNVRNRTFGIVQNGSWAPRAAMNIRDLLSSLSDCNIIETDVTLMSIPKDDSDRTIRTFVTELGFPDMLSNKTDDTEQYDGNDFLPSVVPIPPIQKTVFRDIQYGLFVLTARCNGKDNGCIINTVMQVTETQDRTIIAIAIEKMSLTCDMILNTGIFTVSILTEDVPFELFKRFGFQSGKTVDKFNDYDQVERTSNGLLRITEAVCAFISAQTFSFTDCGTHIVFLANVTEAAKISNKTAITYRYYFEHIRSSLHGTHDTRMVENMDVSKHLEKATTSSNKIVQWQCAICGYIYDNDVLPADYHCPVCGHNIESFGRV